MFLHFQWQCIYKHFYTILYIFSMMNTLSYVYSKLPPDDEQLVYSKYV